MTDRIDKAREVERRQRLEALADIILRAQTCHPKDHDIQPALAEMAEKVAGWLASPPPELPEPGWSRHSEFGPSRWRLD